MTYQPAQYGLLVAPVSPVAAKAITALFSRDKFLAAAALQRPATANELRATWAAIESMAKVFDSMREERLGHALAPEAPETQVQGRSQPSDDSLSAAEAAALIGCSERRVRQLLTAERLEGRRVAGRWLVEASSVQGYVLSKEAA